MALAGMGRSFIRNTPFAYVVSSMLHPPVEFAVDSSLVSFQPLRL